MVTLGVYTFINFSDISEELTDKDIDRVLLRCNSLMKITQGSVIHHSVIDAQDKVCRCASRIKTGTTPKVCHEVINFIVALTYLDGLITAANRLLVGNDYHFIKSTCGAFNGLNTS